jgi:hypothetical protein
MRAYFRAVQMVILTQTKAAFNFVPRQITFSGNKMVGLEIHHGPAVRTSSSLFYHFAPEEICSFLPIAAEGIVFW